jgi:hypothetical protein
VKSVTGLETVRREFEELKLSVERLQEDFTRVANPKPVSPVQSPPRPPAQKPSPSVSSKPEKSQSKVEIPMKPAEPMDPSWDWRKKDAVEKENEVKSLDGIVSYLTKKHGGNVEEKGIVTITSKSIWSSDLKNVADLTSDSHFFSKNEPGQWVCWDFCKMRVLPTHYTICARFLKSWVVEGSLDGSSWTEIDRQTDNQDFKTQNTASFAVSKPAEFRFIRLTQTGKRHRNDDVLMLGAVEFFGTLSE